MNTLTRIILLVASLSSMTMRAQEVSQGQNAVQGQVRIVGSDSMDPLLRLWSHEFQKTHPNVKFTMTAHGSATAPPALAKGESELGPMSREMNAAELEAFKAAKGHEPIKVVVAFDALAIFVNHKNPLPWVRMDHLDALYSETRLSGHPWPIRTWKAFAIPRKWQKNTIVPYSRDEKSGSRALFQEKVLQKAGKLRPEVKIADQMGILDAIGSDFRAIGYGPLNYATPSVRIVPLSPGKAQPAVEPTPKSIRNGSYPLARKLVIYVDAPMAPATKAFMEFVLSKNGQELASGAGAVSLDASMAQDQLALFR